MTISLSDLSGAWIAAKESERLAVECRRRIEDEMVTKLEMNTDLDGSNTSHAEDFTIKVTCRIDRKVDSDMLQELATENGLSEHLAALFRWKPDLNMTAWKSADESITGPLAKAITAKPGRPSFTITRNTKKD